MIIQLGRVLVDILKCDDYLQLWRIEFRAADNSRGIDYWRGPRNGAEDYARRQGWRNVEFFAVDD